MKLFNIKNLFFVLALGFAFLNFDFVLADACTDVCPADKTCSFLPTCKTGCNTGCQPGYYLSDGDGDHRNNCLEETGGLCTKFNTKGVCEICPVGFYCKGGMIDKTPCPPGKYTDKIGSTKQLDCIAPPAGYCVAKATVIGTGTGSVPSVCIEKSNKIKSDNSFRTISSTTDVDIPGTINSGMSNDKGILGYTESNRLGANIAIPCPIGTYSDSTNGAANCKTPDLGYCSSYDGVNCVISDQYKGIPKPTGSDFNNAIVNALGSVNSNSVNPVTALGATTQARCPLGTYDVRTAFGKDNTNPAPFCVYPDLGKKTGSSTGATQQVDCPAGQYDSRWTNSTTPNYCDDIVLNSAACSGGKCDNCKTNDQLYKFTPYPVSKTNQPQAECVACPVGTYQPNTGKTYCIYPPAGKYAPTTGISKLADLSTCSAGSYDSRSSYNSVNFIFTPITNVAIGESEPLNYTSGKISTSCNLCPVGTFQGVEGQAKCEYPKFNSCSALENSFVCSEQARGATHEVFCGDISAYRISENPIKYKFYDPRKINTTPMMAPNPNCSGCQESDYGDWGLTTCQSNDTWIADRSPIYYNVGYDNECDDVTRVSFGYCDFCSGNSGCDTYVEENKNSCNSVPESRCPYGSETSWDNGKSCIGCCRTYYRSCYYRCETTNSWNYCTNKTNKCDSGYRIDGMSCISCLSSLPASNSNTYTLTNPGVDCNWNCNAGYIKQNNNNIPTCQSCGGLPTNGIWANPGVSCDFKCTPGYAKSGNSCMLCSSLYLSKSQYCGWANSGVTCDLVNIDISGEDPCSYTCTTGYKRTSQYKTDLKYEINYGFFKQTLTVGTALMCTSCGDLPTGAVSWGSECMVNCAIGYKESEDYTQCIPCGNPIPNSSWGPNCAIVCNEGYTFKSYLNTKWCE